MREATATRHSESVLDSLPRITDWVRDGWAHIDVESIAQQSNIAPQYFRRVFRTATGEPLIRFVRRMRLQVAAYRAVMTQTPLIDIAITAGYGSAAAFSRAFREEFGSCPADARARQPAQPWVESGAWCGEIYTATQEQERVGFQRHFGRLDAIPMVWRRIEDWMAHRQHGAVMGSRLLICYDDPERHLGQSMRYDVGTILGPDMVADSVMGLQLTRSGPTICTRHLGPLEFLPFSYMHLIVSAVMSGRFDSTAILPFSASYQPAPDGDAFNDVAEIRVLLP